MKLFGAILDLIYPLACASCGAPAPTHLCDACKATIHVHPINTCCSICGRVMMNAASAGKTVATCGLCHRHRPTFDLARSATNFKPPISDLIHAFKYNGATWLCNEMVDLLEGCARAHYAAERFDCICPVPLSRVKERTRGYNQSALLGNALAKRLKRPFLKELLVRRRNTPTQTRLNAVARLKNVAGAFEVPKAMRPLAYGRCVLLVDDVMTTGATLSECATALRQGGVERVLAITVARD